MSVDDEDEDNEKFWVERPADLFSLPRPTKSRTSLFNALTQLVIVVAIVLAVLRIKWWVATLTVGIIIIMFVYYNGHPGNKSGKSGKSGKRKHGQDSPRTVDLSYDECKVALEQGNKMKASFTVSTPVVSIRKNTRTAVSSASVEPFTLHTEPRLDAPRKSAKPITGPTITLNTGTKKKSAQQLTNTTTSTTNAAKKQAEPRRFDSKKYADNDSRDTFRLGGAKHKESQPKELKIPIGVNTPDALEQYYESLEDERQRVAHQFEVEEECMITSAMS